MIYPSLLLAFSSLVSAQTFDFIYEGFISSSLLNGGALSVLSVANCASGVPFLYMVSSAGVSIELVTSIFPYHSGGTPAVVPTAVSMTYKGNNWNITNLVAFPPTTSGSLGSLGPTVAVANDYTTYTFTDGSNVVVSINTVTSQYDLIFNGFNPVYGMAYDSNLNCSPYYIGAPQTTATTTVFSTLPAVTSTATSTAITTVIQPTTTTATTTSTTTQISVTTSTPAPVTTIVSVHTTTTSTVSKTISKTATVIEVLKESCEFELFGDGIDCKTITSYSTITPSP